MHRLTIVVLLTLCFAATAAAQSDLLFYDGFDYTLGEDMARATNGGVGPRSRDSTMPRTTSTGDSADCRPA